MTLFASEKTSSALTEKPYPSKPIRVAFLDHTAQLGGGEIALLHLVAALDRRRIEPVVVLFSDGPLQGKLTAAGVETHLLLLSDRITHTRKDSLGANVFLRLGDLFAAMTFCWRLRRWLKQQRIDEVHCNSLKSDLLGGVASRLARKPCVWHVRDLISDVYLPKNVARAFRLACQVLPTHVVVNSAATGRMLGKIDSTVVHDGTFLPNPLDQPGQETDQLRTGLIGRITWWKGQDVFLRAIALVRKQFPQARFLIVGSALFSEKQYEESLHELVRELNLADVVEFTGFREDIATLLNSLDLVVHASTSGEPFGQVIIEAMAAGKALIATDGGGVPEILTPECGILVPMSDHLSLAEAMATLLTDAARRHEMGRHGRERVKSHFLIQHTADNLTVVLEQIATGILPHLK